MNIWKERIPLVGLTTFTLQDFPDRAASILWFSGCQMACPYCHNPDMATGGGTRIDVDDTLEFLRRRRPMLDGVTFSGGECLLTSCVVPMIEAVKGMGYAVKIDTNGGKPERLRELIEAGLVDYVAMDFKAPLAEYERMTGWRHSELWRESFDLLLSSDVEFEIRTTVYPDLLDESAVDRMMDFLEKEEFRSHYYLQHFQEAPRTLGALTVPSRRFDLRKLNRKRPFPMGFRNFTAHEVKAASEIWNEAT